MTASPACAPDATDRGGKPAKTAGAGSGYWLVTVLSLAAIWLLREADWYSPGSDVGYYTGLAGSIAMLVLLLYPVRKRVRFMHDWLPLKYWFRAHMFLGVTGPLLVVFHSKLHIGSLNAAIAFFSMFAVFLSGLVGRFVYVKIHHGLYGRRTSREDLKAALGLSAQDVQSQLHFVPAVEARLQKFEADILGTRRGWLGRMMLFFTIGPRAAWVAYRVGKALREASKHDVQAAGSDRARLREAAASSKTTIRAYLRAIKAEAQFAAYERLFSLWHVLHVPLVFMLLFTAIVHVLAVHMY